MTSPVEVARLMGGDEAEFGSSSSSSTKVLRTTVLIKGVAQGPDVCR
eukprot:CAMPEP_0114682320 /NCGR_PEP_ID=MMETSP0191-20121206/56395_1 /TAXON_ID=126664 /ORGANISM="Sorites sp." /LENGTH=46 /DNA_ID= /DNA_START= /DNA_END= /DNA_ORIENTATION=